MRLKIILFSFFVFLFATFIQSPAIALSSPIGISGSNIPQPGITCGVIDGIGDLKKCCQIQIFQPEEFSFGNSTLDAGKAVLQLLIDKNLNNIMKQQKSIVVPPCSSGVPSKPGDITNPDCICITEPTKTPLSAITTLCESIKDASERATCKICAKYGGMWTALGCFSGNMSEFIANNVMRTGIGIAGGVSMLCIMLAAFQMQTSSGNAEKIKKAQELLTNCITGLMVIIFSILILKIIGVDILKIPGFK